MIFLGEEPDIQGGGKGLAGFTPEKINKLYEDFSAYSLVFHRRGSHHKGFTVDDLVPFGAFPLKVIRVSKTRVFN
jgi:hypothetical protein